MSDKIQKANEKLGRIVYLRGGLLPEADNEYDDAVVDLINAFAETYNGAYLISVSRASRKVLKVGSKGIKSFRGINEYNYIAKDRKTAMLIITEYKINRYALLDKIHNGEVEAEYLMWT